VSPEITAPAATAWSTPPAAVRGCAPPSPPLRRRPVAGPVGQPEHSLADGQAGGPVAQLGDDTRHLVPGQARRPVPATTISPGSLSGSSPRVNPAACTRTMRSFSAACGYGKSSRDSPARPASRSRIAMACVAISSLMVEIRCRWVQQVAHGCRRRPLPPVTNREGPPIDGANPTRCGRRHMRQPLVLECVRSSSGRFRLGQLFPPDHRTTVSAARFNQSIVAIASVTQSRMMT
jgi:hypothetical protein